MGKPTASPLRYPGGKSALINLMDGIIHNNEFRYYHYAEPYAGGCGLALSLLFGGYVSHIHINDIDLGIWSFWHSVLNQSAELIDLVKTKPITLQERVNQLQILEASDLTNTLELGFSAFFLNRTNRSGIIKNAGAIGGKTQAGQYKIDCRFNRDDLAEKIKRINKYKDRISLYNNDAIDFMRLQESIPDKTLYFIDPPYFNKGASLYTNFYNPDDHAAVAAAVAQLKRPWLVTYDATPQISALYKNFRQHFYNINYSLQTKRKGDELLITSDDIYLGNEFNHYKKVA